MPALARMRAGDVHVCLQACQQGAGACMRTRVVPPTPCPQPASPFSCSPSGDGYPLVLNNLCVCVPVWFCAGLGSWCWAVRREWVHGCGNPPASSGLRGEGYPADGGVGQRRDHTRCHGHPHPERRGRERHDTCQCQCRGQVRRAKPLHCLGLVLERQLSGAGCVCVRVVVCVGVVLSACVDVWMCECGACVCCVHVQLCRSWAGSAPPTLTAAEYLSSALATGGGTTVVLLGSNIGPASTAAGAPVAATYGPPTDVTR